MERRRWLRGVAIAIGILVAVEVVLRLAGVGRAPPRPARFVNPEGAWAAAGVYYESDPDLFWRLRPNAWIVGGWYRTNADGFRGPAAGARRPDVPRVVLLGDSVTFGLGVDDADVYGAILERLLEARLGQDVEVLSRAVPGYSSLQIARLAAKVVPPLAPDLVVVLAGAFNDQAPACGASDAEAARLARARPGPIRRLAIWQGMRRLLGRDGAPPCPPLATAPPAPGAPVPPTRVSPRELESNLRAIVDVAGNAQAAAIVVVPPLSAKIAALQPWAIRYRGAARGVGGCRTVDAARIFEARDVALFEPDELHPNRMGHLVLAFALADRIAIDHTLGEPVDEDAVPADVALAQSRALAADTLESGGGAELAGRLLAEGSAGPRVRLAAARAILRAGRTADAREILGALVRDRPQLVEARQLLAECAAADGDDAGALRALEAGVRMDRGWIHGRVLWIRALRAAGRDREAERELRAGLRIASSDPDLLSLAAGED